MKNDLPYFSHDNDAFLHPKTKALRARYGWEGYGRFWGLNEMICRSEGCRLDLRRPVIRGSFANELGFSDSEMDDFLAFLSDPDQCGLIDYTDGIVTTERTQEDFSRVHTKRGRDRERAQDRQRGGHGQFVGENGEIVSETAETNGDPLAAGPQSRVEKKREEERREDKKDARLSETVSDEYEEIPFPPSNGYDARFNLARDAWNATGLGDERRLLINCAEVVPIKAVFDMYSDEEVMTAIENYQAAFPSIEKTYQYKSFVSFVLKGIHNHHLKPGVLPPTGPAPHCPTCDAEMTPAGVYCDSCGWHP